MLCRHCSDRIYVVAAEYVKLADLPALVDLVFVGNPLEEKYSAEGNWIEEATKRLPKLKKLDGENDRISFLQLIMEQYLI